MTIEIPTAAIRRLYTVLLLLNSLFVAVTLFHDLGWSFATNRVARQFDLKEEATVGVWYSSFLLLLTALAALAASQKPLRREADTRRVYRTWCATSLFFLFVSVDETALIHEKVGTVISMLAGPIPGLTDHPGVNGIMAWVVVGVPVAIACAAGTLYLAESVLAANRCSKRFALAGITCYLCVVALEILEAQLMRWRAARSVQGVLEEGLELLGTTLFLFGFIEYLRSGISSSSELATSSCAAVQSSRL